MQMLSSAKNSLADRLTTPRNKGYASVSIEDNEQELGIIDQRLKADGWHLDEVEDDELDFALPTSTRRKSWLGSVCCCFSGGGDDRRLSL